MTQETKNTQAPEVDFHGAAVISENGKETPITEEMIKRACDSMDNDEPEPDNSEP